MKLQFKILVHALRFCFAFILAVSLLWIAGCVHQSKSQPGDEASGCHQTWDAVYISGQHVGYSNTKTESKIVDGTELIETSNETLLSIQRNGQDAAQTIRLVSVERPDGTVKSISTKFTSGVGEMETSGDLKNDTLQITSFVGGKLNGKKSLKLPDGTLGFFGVEQSLRQKSIKPGDQRTLLLLEPSTLTICRVEMKAVGNQEIEIFGEKRDLLRVISRTVFPGGNSIDGTMWVDARGEILSSKVADLQQTFRTDRKTAMSFDAKNLDLNLQTMVSVDHPIDRAHQTKRATYFAQVLSDDPLESFATGISQQVKTVPGGVAIEVTSIRPTTQTDQSTDGPPADSDRRASSLVQSEDPAIVELSNSVAQNETDPWSIAVALERLVYETVSAKNFSTAFASAAEVARSHEGDCTEHSVLLVALCRARDIPARGVVGLVYAPNLAAFAYHMWTEVWIDNRWIPLDATLGLGGIGAAHIKVGHTSLSEGSGFESFIPIIELVGKLKLKVIEVEY